MNYWKGIFGISLFCCSCSAVFAESEITFSQIEEEMLLNPPSAGSTSDKVMIYSNVRNKTIHKAMDNQFDRIENMMFINTIVETEEGNLSFSDDEC